MVLESALAKVNDRWHMSDFIKERNRIIDEHGKIILQMRAVEKDIEGLLKLKDPSWRALEKKRNELYLKVEPLIQKYWDIVPPVELSRCPYCDQALRRLFDAVDLNGFWWMDRTRRPKAEPECCRHFCLLMGALNFNGLPPVGGLFECLPGPDAPFVVPRILEQPAMQAVISCVPMSCGYSAYPVVYFAEHPPQEKNFTQSWAQKIFHFTDETGKKGWDIKEESYDYNLASLVKSGKLKVFAQGRLSSSADDLQAHPFLNIRGVFKPQVLINNELRYR